MNSTTLAEHILNLEPHHDFLDRAEHQLTPTIFSELVKVLRATSKMPERLAQNRAQWACPVIDVCGTGGSKSSRLNTSTLVALFAPELGFAVIKHGGRSASGKLGSLDLLEKLGLNIPFLYEHASECLRATNLCYLGAGHTYSAFARYSAARKSYGKPSIFNLLGPLLNPASPCNRLIGAYSRKVAEFLAHTLSALNEDGWVVSSADEEGTLDEASPYGTNHFFEVRNNKVTYHEVLPFEFGVGKRTELFGDGIKTALDFLNGVQSTDAIVALHFIAFNLACLSFIHLPTFQPNVFSQNLIDTYNQIKQTFPARLQLANQRLSKLVNLNPLHPKSPTVFGSHLVAEVEQSANAQRKTSSFAVNSFINQDERNSEFKKSNFQMSRGLLLAEIKIQTPLKTFTDSLSLESRLQAYAAADAISVVTHPLFGGSAALLKKVRGLTDKPILAKDFVRLPCEIENLAHAGADGILLLSDMLTAAELKKLLHTCEHLGLTPFVESSWVLPAEFSAKSKMVLNSRNLFSLEEGRNYRDQAARKSAQNTPVILASNLTLPLEIFMALQEHAGVIVGSALMHLQSTSEIKDFLRSCTRPRPLFKACGARNINDIESALNHGADFVGVNLIPTSKRFAGEELVQKIACMDRKIHSQIVFITSRLSPPRLLTTASSICCYEQPYSIPLLANGLGIFAPIQSHLPSHSISAGARLAILDSKVPGAGQTDPFLNNAKKLTLPILIAGGVTSENIMDRFKEGLQNNWNVTGVDTASGIENMNPSAEFGGFDKQRIQDISNVFTSIL